MTTDKFQEIAKTFNFKFPGEMEKTASNPDIVDIANQLQTKIAEALDQPEIDEEFFILDAIIKNDAQ